MAYLFQDSNYKKNLQLLYLVFISKYKRESLANTKKDRFRNGVLKSEEVPTFRVLTVKQVWFLTAFSRTVENTVWYSDFYGFIVHWLIPKFKWLKAGLETMYMAFAKVVEHFSFHYFTYVPHFGLWTQNLTIDIMNWLNTANVLEKSTTDFLAVSKETLWLFNFKLFF